MSNVAAHILNDAIIAFLKGVKFYELTETQIALLGPRTYKRYKALECARMKAQNIEIEEEEC